MKLLEKSRKKANSMNSTNAYRFSNKIVTKIPFLSYRFTIPKQINTRKSSKNLNLRIRSTDFQPSTDHFSYRLTGTSLLSGRYS